MAATLASATLAPLGRAIAPQDVLLVYNSLGAGFDPSILAAYRAAHPGTPGTTSPHEFDLLNANIPAANVTYTEFVTLIRNPIRAEIVRLKPGTEGSIKAVQLLRGIPHRILDPYDDWEGLVGDEPSPASAEYAAGNYQAASVDSELVLLWQDLETGQGATPMSSHSDNFILNPFHDAEDDFDLFSRNAVTIQNSLSRKPGSELYWISAFAPLAQQLTVGDLVLVARLDGRTAADAVASIERARVIRLYRPHSGVLLDEDAIQQFDSTDYEDTREALQASGWPVTHEASDDFVAGWEYAGPPVVLYSSYGINHADDSGQDSQYYLDAFAGRLQDGAAFASYESYNARELNGLDNPRAHESALDFLAVGGTVALGHVWEPFGFAVARMAKFGPAWLDRGETLFEAAWRAHIALSWMNVVLGDGLATTGIANAEISVSAADAQAAETGNPGAFTLHREGDTTSVLAVSIALEGTATQGEDYATVSAPAVFDAGQADLTITITPIPDTDPEGAETVVLRILESTDYAVSAEAASATVALGDAPIDAWRLAHFGDGSGEPDAADLADPDGDRLANLVEYACNLDPKVPDAAGAPRGALAADSETGRPHFACTFRTTPEATDVSLTLESSTNLSAWTAQDWTDPASDVELLSDKTATGGDGRATRSLTVRWKIPLDDPAAPARLFLRLRIDP